jgi:hypothetical protein
MSETLIDDEAIIHFLEYDAKRLTDATFTLASDHLGEFSRVTTRIYEVAKSANAIALALHGNSDDAIKNYLLSWAAAQLDDNQRGGMIHHMGSSNPPNITITRITKNSPIELTIVVSAASFCLTLMAINWVVCSYRRSRDRSIMIRKSVSIIEEQIASDRLRQAERVQLLAGLVKVLETERPIDNVLEMKLNSPAGGISVSSK